MFYEFLACPRIFPALLFPAEVRFLAAFVFNERLKHHITGSIASFPETCIVLSLATTTFVANWQDQRNRLVNANDIIGLV